LNTDEHRLTQIRRDDAAIAAKSQNEKSVSMNFDRMNRMRFVWGMIVRGIMAKASFHSPDNHSSDIWVCLEMRTAADIVRRHIRNQSNI
jgi:hypothetical protein